MYNLLISNFLYFSLINWLKPVSVRPLSCRFLEPQTASEPNEAGSYHEIHGRQHSCLTRLIWRQLVTSHLITSLFPFIFLASLFFFSHLLTTALFNLRLSIIRSYISFYAVAKSGTVSSFPNLTHKCTIVRLWDN